MVDIADALIKALIDRGVRTVYGELIIDLHIYDVCSNIFSPATFYISSTLLK